MEPSSNMKAVLIIAEHKELGKILTPLLNIERDEIDWERLNKYEGTLSGGFRAAISWAVCLFCDEVPPEDWGYRDPFGSFGAMDRELQALVMKALALRHGYLAVSLTDKPKSGLQELLELKEKELTEKLKKEKMKLIKGDKSEE